MLFFGLRGRETMRQLCKTSIVIEIDSDGTQYATIHYETLVKNSLAEKNFLAEKNLSRKEFESIKHGWKYST